MSTPDEKKKREEAAAYAKKTQKPTEGSPSKAGMGILPPGADGDFLQLQPLPLQPPLSNFVNPQQQQKSFQQLGTQFLQQNPSLSNVCSMQGGAGAQAMQFAGPGKYMALASFLQQASNNNGTKDTKFGIDIGNNNPMQLIQGLKSANVLDKIDKISCKENGQSMTLGPQSILEMAKSVTQQVASTIFKLPGISKPGDKPRPDGFQ